MYLCVFVERVYVFVNMCRCVRLHVCMWEYLCERAHVYVYVRLNVRERVYVLCVCVLCMSVSVSVYV